MTDYRVSPIGPARPPEASITVWPNDQGSDGSLRPYLARLLDGLVSEQAIAVMTPITGKTRSEEAPQQEPAHSLDAVRLSRYRLLPCAGHLHGLATAGAMLTCVAVVLNVGPFAQAPKIDGLRSTVGGQAAPAIMKQPNGSSSIPGREVFSQSAAEPEEISEPTRVSMRLSSLSVLAVAPLASQPASPNDGGSEMESRPPQQDPVSARQPATQLHPVPASPELVKEDTIVGVWAPDAGACSARDFRDGLLPAVINTDGAAAGDTFCMFTKREQTDKGWRVVAKCSNPRERWTSNVRLTVTENRLTWASKRGTQAYTRCAPDVLMAQAR